MWKKNSVSVSGLPCENGECGPVQVRLMDGLVLVRVCLLSASPGWLEGQVKSVLLIPSGKYQEASTLPIHWVRPLVLT